jgi:UDP-N-acetylmuramoyl-L-alanine---L-glutamate ligase
VADPLGEIAARSVVIAGFGVEGRDVFRFLRAKFPGKTLAVAEARPLEALEAESRALLTQDPHVELHVGPDHLAEAGRYEVIVRSPGIPLGTPAFQAAAARGTTLTSQTAMFLALRTPRVIGVTGTKGKSTTSALIHTMLRAAGRESHLVGNIGAALGGESPLEALGRATERAIFVYELSSFQLEGLEQSPDIAVLLDIVPEHLDHHGGFGAYVAAKETITRHQTARDWLVYDASSPTSSVIAGRSGAQLMPCRIDGPVERGCFVEDNHRIVFAAAFGREDVMLVSDVTRALPGRFNLRNVLPAAAVARILSIDTGTVVSAIQNFQPLRDRFENVGTFRGITFYNAAIATVPEATIAHLASLAPRVATLILGGVDRGVDYAALAARILEDRIATVILFPDTGARVWSEIEKLAGVRRPRRIDVSDMQTAVRTAYELTPSGSICLHSPAAPSRGGLFASYAARGEQYRMSVTRLGA